ncbi:MAG TPA: aminopeptidase P family protein [Acidilobales archaeon]|nr:aminopeptidase P family protein [Acidilobales archaeon]
MVILKMVFESRLRRFQELLKMRGIDAAMIRVLSTFTYFTGTRWLRPALLIPSEGDPVLFVAKGEEEGITERTWVKNLEIFSEGGELMRKVSGLIRRMGFKTIGLEFGIERDAYIIFYEMFKRLNPHVRVIDISDMIYELRMVKDSYEIENIRIAGAIAAKVMEKVRNSIKLGMSETEIAAEAYYHAYRLGSEQPKVYVNIGPNPRVHSEPFRDIKIRKGVAVTVILGIDYSSYYVNVSRTFLLGVNDLGRKALECMKNAYELARKLTRPGIKPVNVMNSLDNVYKEYGFLDNRVLGYLHGVGLQVEELPITTIIPKHRFMALREGMVVAFIHAPLMIKGLGQVKEEDTFILTSRGIEQVTKMPHSWEWF